mmetsp:Transcript_30821/g.95361  ORF Transcript_30821/g.95361 Transcript_30821/m.95361 type:complete len:92 (+) Transcript_30821:785-1060(+)
MDNAAPVAFLFAASISSILLSRDSVRAWSSLPLPPPCASGECTSVSDFLAAADSMTLSRFSVSEAADENSQGFLYASSLRRLWWDFYLWRA